MAAPARGSWRPGGAEGHPGRGLGGCGNGPAVRLRVHHAGLAKLRRNINEISANCSLSLTMRCCREEVNQYSWPALSDGRRRGSPCKTNTLISNGRGMLIIFFTCHVCVLSNGSYVQNYCSIVIRQVWSVFAHGILRDASGVKLVLFICASAPCRPWYTEHDLTQKFVLSMK